MSDPESGIRCRWALGGRFSAACQAGTAGFPIERLLDRGVVRRQRVGGAGERKTSIGDMHLALASHVHSDPSARLTSTFRAPASHETRTSHGLQQTSQSCTKLPCTSGSM